MWYCASIFFQPDLAQSEDGDISDGVNRLEEKLQEQVCLFTVIQMLVPLLP